MSDPKKVTEAVGRILSDPTFRRSFEYDPENTLKDVGLEVDRDTLNKLNEVNKRVKETGVAKPPGSPENAIHCNIASSVGVA